MTEGEGTTSFNMINIIGLVLLVPVLVFGGIFLFKFISTYGKFEIPYNVENSFDRLSGIIQAVEDKEIGTLTTFSFAETASLIYVDSMDVKRAIKGCKEGESCICLEMYNDNINELAFVKCKKVSSILIFKSKISKYDKTEKLESEKHIDDCLSNSMDRCDEISGRDDFTSEDNIYIALLKVYKDGDNLVIDGDAKLSSRIKIS